MVLVLDMLLVTRYLFLREPSKRGEKEVTLLPLLQWLSSNKGLQRPFWHGSCAMLFKGVRKGWRGIIIVWIEHGPFARVASHTTGVMAKEKHIAGRCSPQCFFVNGH